MLAPWRLRLPWQKKEINVAAFVCMSAILRRRREGEAFFPASHCVFLASSFVYSVTDGSFSAKKRAPDQAGGEEQQGREREKGGEQPPC